jgi:hypothetical protein
LFEIIAHVTLVHDVDNKICFGAVHEHIHFYDIPVFTILNNSYLIHWFIFTASCGGLLGLYLGFSILSFVEIIYFFTVRLCCNFQSNKKKPPAP